MFDIGEYEFLMYGFTEYATEHVKLKPSTFSRYKVILDDYFEKYIIDKIAKGDYAEIFNIDRLSLIKRKSNNVRPSLLQFLEFLRYESFIEQNVYYQFNNDIKSIFFAEEQVENNEDEIDFLTPNDIRTLFSGRLVFKYDYEEALIPLVCSLTFFNMFKQEDVVKLLLSDIDFEKKRIRNVRRLEANSDLVEWLSLNDITFEYLTDYLKYRNKQGYSGDILLIMENSTLDNGKINRLFSCFDRVANKGLFRGKKIYQELLRRSMMFHILHSTDGRGIYKILLEQDITKPFEYAFNEYISIMRAENKSIVSANYNIEDILPNKKPDTLLRNQYSERNDVNEQDIHDFDMNNERNLEQNKVSIQRMVRDSKIARQLKISYNNECQLCGYKLRKSNGEFTSEAHHLQPYNKLHRGDDISHNIIVLCPNCHTQFDDLYFAINPETEEVHCIFEAEDEYHLSKLKMNEGHILGKKYLQYTWNLFERNKEINFI
ncbi:HNH endonuclease [Bacillus sp. ISL-41]|uniref:HNH endonuclease n=1 Tax=Bacillus sp. ISL-41 TaxID=2819127 RepID=UPI001BEB980C|nr:HNH endonuclease [Bacillus sp. ISL-41]MBT2641288.1 HNH endonuclease [Bacillus sp. ISL-41]